MIQHISAVTFAVRDMARADEVYRKIGFEVLYRGHDAFFSSLKAGEAFVNLSANPGYEHRWWGRVIFRVESVNPFDAFLLNHNYRFAALARTMPHASSKIDKSCGCSQHVAS